MKLPYKPELRWHEYLELEKQGTRKSKLDALARFIRSFQELPQSQQDEWGLYFATEKLQHNLCIPLRQPLFEKIVFPSLLTGLNHELPGSRRLLAEYFTDIVRSKNCRTKLPTHLQSAEALLRDELRVNPNDDEAGRKLEPVSKPSQHDHHTR